MNTTYLPFDAGPLGDSGTTRTPGLHASDIYEDLYKELQPSRYDQRDESEKGPPPLILTYGLAIESSVEEWLARQLVQGGSDIQRPGEFTAEGAFDGHAYQIHYTPDLFIFNGEFRVGEIKATKMSPGVPKAVIVAAQAGEEDARAAISEAFTTQSKFAKYRCQLMLYAWFLKTRLGRFYVYFVNGCYKPDMEPVFLSLDIAFSQDDLDTNVAMVMYHAIARKMI